MKKKNRNIRIVIITISIAILFSLSYLKKDIWDVNAEKLRHSFDIISGTAVIDDLYQWTPFDWDVMYSFRPYISKERVYEVVGYKWDNISETVNENMNQIVFLKDNEVICYLYGYPNNTGLEFHFGEYEGDYIKFNSNDLIPFNSTFDDKNQIRYFNYIDE